MKEADILKGVKSYLDWEGIWHARLPAGRARVGGEFIKLPESIAALVRGLLFSKNVKPASWDGSIRIHEQWLPLAPKGTPDVIVTVPAGRPAYNETLGDYETFACARTVYIETKRSDGKLTKEQGEYAREARARGALFWVIRDLDELRKMLPPKMELRFHGPTSTVDPEVVHDGLKKLSSPENRKALEDANWNDPAFKKVMKL